MLDELRGVVRRWINGVLSCLEGRVGFRRGALLMIAVSPRGVLGLKKNKDKSGNIDKPIEIEQAIFYPWDLSSSEGKDKDKEQEVQKTYLSGLRQLLEFFEARLESYIPIPISRVALKPSVLLCIPDDFCIIRRVSLDGTLDLKNSADLEDQIVLLYEQMIPFSLEDSYYDYILGPKNTLLIVASLKQKIDPWLAEIEKLGFRIDRLMPYSLSLEQVSSLEKEQGAVVCLEKDGKNGKASVFRFSKKVSKEEQDKLNSLESELRACFGLFFCWVFKDKKINLLPWREEERKKANRQFLIWNLIALFSLLVPLGFFKFYCEYKTVQGEEAVQILLREKNHFSEQIQDLNELANTKKMLLRRFELLEHLKAKQTNFIRFFELLPSLLPEGIHIQSLATKQEILQLEGNAKTHSCIAAFLKTLAEQPELRLADEKEDKKLQLTEVNTDKQEPGLKFKLQFKRP